MIQDKATLELELEGLRYFINLLKKVTKEYDFFDVDKVDYIPGTDEKRAEILAYVRQRKYCISDTIDFLIGIGCIIEEQRGFRIKNMNDPVPLRRADVK